ncbi:MAG: VPLPA-CTERM sorting domain-containing protein [Chromatiales bacterium]|nr:MAG: VPLPA-CTERM sorting domain-containing protein [Chromatiales bacterium]
MTTRVWGAGCSVLVGSLLTVSAQAAFVNVFAKVTAAGSYAVEVEVADFTDANSIFVVNDAAGRVPLFFDSGEGNWDAEAEDLELAELGAFFDTTFDLEINHSAGQSIYRGTSVGAPGPGDFPVPASFLTVDDRPTPTAQWVGGDATADALIITYATGDDEFTDGFDFFPDEDGSRTLSFPLDPGFYDVALGFYYDFGVVPLTLLTGDDVLGEDTYNLASVGETFSSTEIVPVPAAAWLLLSGLGTLVTIRRRQK